MLGLPHHADVQGLIIMRETFDGWQVETFRMYRGAMIYAPAFLHAWRRWFQLARGLGWARHRIAITCLQAYFTNDDWRLMQGLGLRSRPWPSRQQWRAFICWRIQISRQHLSEAYPQGLHMGSPRIDVSLDAMGSACERARLGKASVCKA